MKTKEILISDEKIDFFADIKNIIKDKANCILNLFTENGNILNNKILIEFITHNPLPVVIYDDKGKPIFWNEVMENETGYTFAIVADYYKKHGEVMSLLYKGKNYETVKERLRGIEETGIGYAGVSFTLNTNPEGINTNGEEKTLKWTTLSFGKQTRFKGTIRTATLVKDNTEIIKELEYTKMLLSIDPLTGAYNRYSLNNDIKAINLKNRSTDAKDYIISFIDIDNFKKYNDNHSHEHGDKVLKDVVNFAKDFFRKDDKVYRFGGDEFCFIFESEDQESVVLKIADFRKKFFEEFGIGLSIGVSVFEKYSEKIFEEIKHEADSYMYEVKKMGKNGVGFRLNKDTGIHVINDKTTKTFD